MRHSKRTESIRHSGKDLKKPHIMKSHSGRYVAFCAFGESSEFYAWKCDVLALGFCARMNKQIGKGE